MQLKTGYDEQKYGMVLTQISNLLKLFRFAFSDPFDIIDLKPNETVENSPTNFVFVGVMTAKNFLDGRATAVYNTWGKEVPGKIAFFSSEKSYSESKAVVPRRLLLL